MIPHRMLSNEIGCNGLRERVTACRKRLRVNRVTHRQPHALNEVNELFPEVVPESQNYLTGMPATVPVCPGSDPAQALTELNENETARLTEGQEVGIT
jgi:hypothetical protein